MPRASENMPRFAIIIPVLDEAGTIETCLARLQHLRAQGAGQGMAQGMAQGTAIVVADGGSLDATRDLAAPFSDCVIAAPRGRAAQMNAGAAKMPAEIYIFLHADTILPPGALDLIGAALQNGTRQWGRFDVRFDTPHMMLTLVAFMMNLRSRMSGIATGDQAIFITRAAFVRAGGFPAIA